MILTKTIVIKPNSKTLKYYKNLGYECAINSKIEILAKQLTKGSHQIIDVKCDFCGKEKKLDYNSYWRNTKHLNEPYSCCEKCGLEKRNKTNIDKYGVENVFETKEIKEKIKTSYLNNLGVSHPSLLKETHEKIKNTNLKRYGSECSLLNDKIKKKREDNFLLKYGVKNPIQSLKSQETKKNKIIEKYKHNGLKDIKDGKYFIDCDKGHSTCIDKYIFYNRIKLKTIICTECNPIGDYHRSGLEIELSQFIKDNYNGEIINNKKFSYQEIDVYLPELKLGFDFNEVYWHNELNKDKLYHYNKSNFFEERGIKFIQVYEDD